MNPNVSSSKTSKWILKIFFVLTVLLIGILFTYNKFIAPVVEFHNETDSKVVFTYTTPFMRKSVYVYPNRSFNFRPDVDNLTVLWVTPSLDISCYNPKDNLCTTLMYRYGKTIHYYQ